MIAPNVMSGGSGSGSGRHFFFFVFTSFTLVLFKHFFKTPAVLNLSFHTRTTLFALKDPKAKACCWDCNVFYIDKTKRPLHDRKTEHFRSLTKNDHSEHHG